MVELTKSGPECLEYGVCEGVSVPVNVVAVSVSVIIVVMKVVLATELVATSSSTADDWAAAGALAMREKVDTPATAREDDAAGALVAMVFSVDGRARVDCGVMDGQGLCVGWTEPVTKPEGWPGW
jgi:hypothetical protein